MSSEVRRVREEGRRTGGESRVREGRRDIQAAIESVA